MRRTRWALTCLVLLPPQLPPPPPRPLSLQIPLILQTPDLQEQGEFTFEDDFEEPERTGCLRSAPLGALRHQRVGQRRVEGSHLGGQYRSKPTSRA